MMVLIRRYWARSIVVAGEIGGRGDMGVGFIRRKFVCALLCSLFALAVIAAQAQMFYVGFKNCLTVDIGLNLMKV